MHGVQEAAQAGVAPEGVVKAVVEKMPLASAAAFIVVREQSHSSHSSHSRGSPKAHTVASVTKSHSSPSPYPAHSASGSVSSGSSINSVSPMSADSPSSAGALFDHHGSKPVPHPEAASINSNSKNSSSSSSCSSCSGEHMVRGGTHADSSGGAGSTSAAPPPPSAPSPAIVDALGSEKCVPVAARHQLLVELHATALFQVGQAWGLLGV